MTINVSPDPRLQFFGNDGKPLVGGKLYTYAAGTTTLLATYIDWYGVTPNTNPIILDSRGEASVWLGTARYKFVLKDANDVEIYTQDNLIMSPGADGAGAYGTWPIDISGNAATATTASTAAYATTAGSAGTVTGGYVQSVTAGTNITIGGTATNPVINAASAGGTVTSVSGSGSYGFSLTGGPITGSGTLNVTPPTPGTSGNVLTSNGTNWVSQTFTGSTTFGGVGTYAFCVFTSTPAIQPGNTTAGSNLAYSGTNNTTNGTPSGTWKAMGDGLISYATLWLRIA
jgi:hypothetical protein